MPAINNTRNQSMENENIGDGMSFERYTNLITFGGDLTQTEIDAGWHWCGSWDDLLVGPGMDNAFGCHCGIKKIQEWIDSPGGKALKAVLDQLDQELNEENPFNGGDAK